MARRTSEVKRAVWAPKPAQPETEPELEKKVEETHVADAEEEMLLPPGLDLSPCSHHSSELSEEASLLSTVAQTEDIDAPPGLEFPPPGIVMDLAEPVIDGCSDEKQDIMDLDVTLGDLPMGDDFVMAPPPGLRPPPGLEETELRSVGTTACHLVINGLPKKLLNEVMLEVVIEQAGFEAEVTGFTFQKGMRGEKNREVILGFTSYFAAERCLAHFDGCQWGATAITCELIQAEGAAEAACEAEPAVEKLEQQWWDVCGYAAWLADLAALNNMAAMQAQLQQEETPQQHTFSLDAAVFVPSAPCKTAGDAKDNVRKISDASTDIGSELSEDTEGLDFSAEGDASMACVVAAW